MTMSAIITAGCGSTQSQVDLTERSMREFELAASLRTEGSLPGALSHLRLALQFDPQNARAHLLLGYIHMERRELPAAERELRLAIAILAKRKDQNSLRAEANNLYGSLLIQMHRYGEAVLVLRRAASDAYNAAPFFAWGNLGWAHYKLAEYPQALAALQRSTQSQPRFCVGYFRIGKVYTSMGDLPKAEAAFTRAIEADERCGRYYQEAWALRGETRARLGRRQDAIADFERCMQIGADTKTGGTCKTFLESSPR